MADPIMNNSIQKNTDTLRIYTLLNTTIDINDNKIKG
jgi:hypothetical protein